MPRAVAKSKAVSKKPAPAKKVVKKVAKKSSVRAMKPVVPAKPYKPAIGGPHDPILAENPVKAKLKRGEVVVAGTIMTPSVDSAVIMASAFDLIWIEGEHSPITLESTHNIIMATRGMKAAPFVRVPWQDMWMAKRVMDIGALGVIFPFSSTLDRIRSATRSIRYPPMGGRGCGPTLA